MDWRDIYCLLFYLCSPDLPLSQDLPESGGFWCKLPGKHDHFREFAYALYT